MEAQREGHTSRARLRDRSADPPRIAEPFDPVQVGPLGLRSRCSQTMSVHRSRMTIAACDHACDQYPLDRWVAGLDRQISLLAE